MDFGTILAFIVAALLGYYGVRFLHLTGNQPLA